MDAWAAFIAAYQGHRAIADVDLLAVNLFVFVRQLWFMGVHAMLAAVIGTSTFGVGTPQLHLNELRRREAELAPWKTT